MATFRYCPVCGAKVGEVEGRYITLACDECGRTSEVN